MSLVLNASFSRTVSFTVTFGWAAMYSSARSCHSFLPGSLFWTCHQSMVTGAAVELGGAALV